MYQLFYGAGSSSFTFVIYNPQKNTCYGLDLKSFKGLNLNNSSINYTWFTPDDDSTPILSAASAKDLIPLLTTEHPELLI